MMKKKLRELLKMIMETYSENEKKKLIKLIRIAIGPIEEKEYKYLSLYEIHILDLEIKLENKDKTIEKMKKQLELKNNGG